MAHFAQLDENNSVVRVVVVNNQELLDDNGTEQEQKGIEFCEFLFGGIWKQTSYNANFRKNYAGVGYTYRADIDAFVPPQPYLSWVLNENAQWEPPVPMPEDVEMPEGSKMYFWDEANQSWVANTVEGAPV
jgi:hypothetical protein